MTMTDEAVAIARLEARMDYLLQDWETVKGVLLERSGDVAKMGQFERDLNGLGDKVRALEHRIDLVQRARAREIGIAVGILATLQVIWAIAGEPIKGAIFGGGR